MAKNKRPTPKQQFIGKYLDRKMKNHGLPMGLAYYNLLHDMGEKAEKAWKQKIQFKMIPTFKLAEKIKPKSKVVKGIIKFKTSWVEFPSTRKDLRAFANSILKAIK